MMRLIIRADANNHASQRVALSAGFRPAGRDRCAERLRDGTLADLLRFELVEADLSVAAGPEGHRAQDDPGIPKDLPTPEHHRAAGNHPATGTHPATGDHTGPHRW
jgi:hypothetical protein